MSKINIKPVSDDLILERLRFENPWWESGIIDSDDEIRTVEYKGIKIHFIPSSLYAYTIGYNTLFQKNSGE